MSDATPTVYHADVDALGPATQKWCDDQQMANANQFAHRELIRRVSALNIADDLRLLQAIATIVYSFGHEPIIMFRYPNE